MKARRLFFGLIGVSAIFGLWFWKASLPPIRLPAEASAPPIPRKAASAQASTASALVRRSYPSAAAINALQDDPELTTAQKTILREDPSKAVRYAMFAQMLSETNSKRIDFYGKVVDQHGQPIAGVQVKGSILLAVSPIASANKEVVTETDTAGRFQFVGLRGADFGVLLQKAGYESNGKSNWSAGYKPDLNNPLVFTLWKLQGAEPMVHWELNRIGLTCDGTANNFDVLAGQRSQGVGDVVVQFVRNPLNVVRGKPFDWNLTLQIPSGGIAEITSIYPNEAPKEGYQPSISISVAADAKDWSPSFEHSYYFTARGGQIFGRMIVRLAADYEQPPTHFELEVYANPSGSRNLEFDPRKTVKVVAPKRSM
jgi:hypothetical protein